MSKTTSRDTGLGSLPLPSNQERTPRRRGWFAVALAAALLLLGVAWDQRLKHSPLPGYAPPAAWHGYSRDAAATFRDFARTPRGKALREELARPLHEASVQFRTAMGIRPTPERWRRWCGKRLLAWGDGQDWALCVRPGLLAHAADLLFGEGGQEGSRKLGAAYYAWHDGFLLLSPSRDYLLESQARLRVFKAAAAFESSALLLQWGSASRPEASPDVAVPPAAHLLLRAGDANWLLNGRIEASLPSREAPLPRGFAWPQAPLLEIWGGHPREWRQVLETLAQYPVSAMLPAAFWDYAAPLLETWRVDTDFDSLLAQSDSFGLALVDIDTSMTLPVPEWALLCGVAGDKLEALMAAFPPPEERIPHAWGARKGFLWPFLGEAVLVAAASAGNGYVLTSRAALMAPLLDALESAESSGEGIEIRADFGGIAAKARALLMQGTRLELVPRHNEQDLERDLLPGLRAFGHLGQLRLRLEPAEDHVVFTGTVSAGAVPTP